MVIFKNSQNYFQVNHMIILTHRVYQNIINEENHKQIKILLKNMTRKVHEWRQDAYLTKWDH